MTDEAKALVERLREKIADTLLAGLPYNRDGREAADLIETQAREIVRLREALRVMIYETAHLSPMEPDGSHWCRITTDALNIARAALGGSHDQ